MSMNAYTIAYAVGYYYGRAYPSNEQVQMPEEDQAVVKNQGFQDGFIAGRHDFEKLDLPREAAIAEQK